MVASDISPVQLALNERMVGEAGAESGVEARVVLDVADLSSIDDASFDAVVVFGGPLSYAFDAAETALQGCLRVCRPGGTVLASVMSLIGSLRDHLAGVVDEMSVYGAETIDTMLHTGEQRHDHITAGCSVGARSRTWCAGSRASSWRRQPPMRSRPATGVCSRRSNGIRSAGRTLAWEEVLTQEPGALDAGTHILFAVRGTTSGTLRRGGCPQRVPSSDLTQTAARRRIAAAISSGPGSQARSSSGA